jgi:cell division transport system permease protein
LPRLVTVDQDPKAPATPEAMNAALAKAAVDASLDDHGQWIKDVQRAGLLARMGALAACLLTGAAAAAAIAFATRAGLAAGREVVEVLHLNGAKDDFIAALFQRRFATLACIAGAWGAGFAALAAAGLKLSGGSQGFSPVLPMSWLDLIAIVPCPLLAALVAAVAARRTAMGILSASP